MFDIYLRESGHPDGFSIEEFARKFSGICSSHREAGRALAFAFILFDYEHPEVRKVLFDQTYWDALDKISGQYLTVFSFNLKLEENSRTKSRAGGHHPANKQPLHGVNTFLEAQFHIKFPQSCPLILFFQVQEDQILPPYVYEIKAESVESAFREIKSALSEAVESVKEVQPEFKGNTREIFDLIKQNFAQRKVLRKATVFVNIARQTKDLFSR